MASKAKFAHATPLGNDMFKLGMIKRYTKKGVIVPAQAGGSRIYINMLFSVLVTLITAYSLLMVYRALILLSIILVHITTRRGIT